MKSLYLLILLIAISSVYSRTLSKREDCLSQMEKYEDCFTNEENNEEVDTSKISKEDLKKFCDSVTKKKCKKFFENPDKYLDKCSAEELIAPKLLITGTGTLFKTICTKDGGDNYCPIIKLSFEEDVKVLDDKKLNETLKNTCKSKLCTDTLRTTITMYENIVGSNNIKSAKEYLSSEECTSKNSAQSLTIISGTLILAIISFMTLLY